MSLTAIGVGMAALAGIGGGLGIGSQKLTEKFVVPY